MLFGYSKTMEETRNLCCVVIVVPNVPMIKMNHLHRAGMENTSKTYGTSISFLGTYWAQDMITFMMVIMHFCHMYICVFHLLKELFEEFHDKMA